MLEKYKWWSNIHVYDKKCNYLSLFCICYKERYYLKMHLQVYISISIRSSSYLVFAQNFVISLTIMTICLQPDIPPSFEKLTTNSYASGRTAPQACFWIISLKWLTFQARDMHIREWNDKVLDKSSIKKGSFFKRKTL